MPAWLLWALIAVALTVGEIATPGLFFLGPIALAAVAAAIVAAARRGLGSQLIVFAVGSVASLRSSGRSRARHLRMPAAMRTGTAALVGARRRSCVERVDR